MVIMTGRECVVHDHVAAYIANRPSASLLAAAAAACGNTAVNIRTRNAVAGCCTCSLASRSLMRARAACGRVSAILLLRRTMLKSELR